MHAASGSPGTEYELNLRKLGAWLDAVLAYRITVTEVPHGFVVRYHQRDLDPVFVERFFSAPEIAALRLGDLRLRRRMAGRFGNRIQGMALEPGGYQDLFRALGHELDALRATNVRLQEMVADDTLTVRFDENGREPRELDLGPDERSATRMHARSRRRERKRWAVLF